MFEGLSSGSAAGFWFQLFARASVHAFVVLAIVALFWFCLRRRISHAFAHGLFLLVPVKFALVIVFGLLSVQLSVDIPITPATRPVNFELQGQNGQIILEPKSTVPGFDKPGHDSIEFVPAGPGFERIDLSDATPVSNSVVSKHTRSLSSDFLTGHHVEYRKPSIIMLAMIIWGITSITLTVRFLIQTIRMHRCISIASGGDSARLAGIMAELADQIGLRRVPRIVTTSAVASPAVFGLIRPTLLIPEGFESAFDEYEMRWAIAHELAHSKRRDLWAVAFERAVGLAGFFHPALWISRRATANFREQACDDFACRVTGLPPRACAETFLKILVWADRRSAIKVGSPLLLGLNPGYPAIRRRVENMTDMAASNRPVRLKLKSATTLILLAALVSVPIIPNLMARNSDHLESGTAEQIENGDSEESNSKSAPNGKLIRLRATDKATRKPVVGADVTYVVDTQEKVVLKTDSEGEASIPFDSMNDNVLRYWATKDGYVNSFDGWRRDTEIDFPPPIEIQVKLKPAIKIGGRIVDQNGQPIEGAEVAVRYKSRSRDRNGDENTHNLEVQAKTDARGIFSSDRFDPDAIEAQVYVGHSRFVTDEKAESFRYETDWMPDLISSRYVLKMKPGKSIAGKVIGTDGNPVSGATVWNYDGSSSFEDTGLRTSPDGKFHIENVGHNRPGELWIGVSKAGVGWAVDKISEADIGTLKNYSLKPPRRLTVRVHDGVIGKPLAGARVNMSFGSNGRWDVTSQLTGPDGLYIANDLPAAEIGVSAYLAGFEIESDRVNTVSTEVVDLVLKPRHIIDGTVTDADTGKPIDRFMLAQYDRMGGENRTFAVNSVKSGHRFRITDVQRYSESSKSGQFRLRFEAQGFEPFVTDFMNADSPPKTLPIALKPLQANKFLTGRVLRPDGTPASGAAVGYYTSNGFESRRYLPAVKDGQVVGMQFIRMGHEGLAQSNLVRTGRDGAFRIPADFERIGWVITHESGVFQSRNADSLPTEPSVLKLQPWSRVEGQYLIDGEPASGALVKLDYPFGAKLERLQGNPALIFTPTPGVNLDQPVRTDAQGRFRFENVIPGPFRLSYFKPGEAISRHYIAGVIESESGKTVRIEYRRTQFGSEEIAYDDHGGEISRNVLGSNRPGFRIFGKIVDADTGESVPRTWSYAFSGYESDQNLWIPMGFGMSGFFETQAIAPLSLNVKPETVNPWLIVIAEGYEPYISPDRIRNEGKPVRRDVRLKKVDKSKWKVYRGRVENSDGSTPGGVRIHFTIADPGVKLGDAVFRWAMRSDVAIRTNADGTFEFSYPRELDKLVFSNETSTAVVPAADFTRGFDAVAKLGKYARIEGRMTRGNLPVKNLAVNVEYGVVTDNMSDVMARVEIQSDGTFIISHMLPKQATLSFYDTTDRRKVDLLKTLEVDCKLGETKRVDIAIDDDEASRIKTKINGNAIQSKAQ